MNDLLLRFAITTGTDPNSTTTINIPTGSADSLLSNGLNLMYFLAGTVAVIVIIISAIKYVSSSGDAGKVTVAKNMISYAIIGLIVILVAFVLTNFVLGRFSS